MGRPPSRRKEEVEVDVAVGDGEHGQEEWAETGDEEEEE